MMEFHNLPKVTQLPVVELRFVLTSETPKAVYLIILLNWQTRDIKVRASLLGLRIELTFNNNSFF